MGKDLKSPTRHHIFVEESILIVLEKKSENRRDLGKLLKYMLREGVVDMESMCKGLAVVVEFAPDFAVDIPHIYKYLGEVIGEVVIDATLPLNTVAKTLEPLVSSNKAGIVMAEALSVAVQVTGSEEKIAALWSQAAITWDKLLAADEDVGNFVKDRKVEFTLKGADNNSVGGAETVKPTNMKEDTPATKTTTPSANNNDNNKPSLQSEMIDILTNTQQQQSSEAERYEELIRFIETRTEASERKSVAFIRALTVAVCSSTIARNPQNVCECRTDLLKKRKNILLKYIDRKKELELESVYALQELAEQLEHPIGLLDKLFMELYEGDVITEETFLQWESSRVQPVGKGSALSSVKDFLIWLKKAEEESAEEEISAVSPTPTNLA